ncbi:MAG: tryptophan synthase subunit alpha [Candidatus Omnitrophota bacterium]
MTRIEKKFRELKRQNKKAFIAFITAGYPNLQTTERLIREFDKIGVDIIELGVPFSDPMADGQVIQEASFEALKKGTHLVDILKLVKRIRKEVAMSISLMTYYNPIFCFGIEKFINEAKNSGVDGLIIPDLPLDEGKSFVSLANKARIDVIGFVTPTTLNMRAKMVASKSTGFIYYVSLTGVTGARQELPKDLQDNIKAIKRLTKKPVCVGFGVSTKEQVKEVSRFCDGTIVGSAIVKKIKENIGNKNLIEKVSNFVKGLIN